MEDKILNQNNGEVNDGEPKIEGEVKKHPGSTKSDKRKKKDVPVQKLQPHILKQKIKLDDNYYSAHKEELEKILQALNSEVNAAAIFLTADEFTELNIEIDLDKLQMITTRRAGRRKKKTNVLYEQIIEYSKTHTHMETAEWLGLTRQTYYRKLKAHKAANHD